jgi:hypothetical protein
MKGDIAFYKNVRILSRMSVDGRTDSSNDNVFESVESEQGNLLLYIEKNSFLCLFIQWETNLWSHDPTFWISKVILKVTVSLCNL